jgi:hypothetical protein
MCTLTIVPLPNGNIRVAHNRDESRNRPQGLLPEIVETNSYRAIYPIDPTSGGTWIAVNERGLVLAILNGNPFPKMKYQPRQSRGKLIPTLLGCDSPSQALQLFEYSFTLTDFAPFRLVVIHQQILVDIVWDGKQSTMMNRLLGSMPLMFTSSGLGDHLVDSPRRELFESMFATSQDKWSQTQDEYHRHFWPDREELSVCMTRKEARTVSLTIMELSPQQARVSYYPERPDQVDVPLFLTLDLVLIVPQ